MYRQIPKHSYLCKVLPDINPRVIDYIVNKELALKRGEKIEELSAEPDYEDLSVYLRASLQVLSVYKYNISKRISLEEKVVAEKILPSYLDAQLHFLPFKRLRQHYCRKACDLDLRTEGGVTCLREIFEKLNSTKLSDILNAIWDLKDIVEDKSECFEALKYAVVARLLTLSQSKNDKIREGCATLILIIAEQDLGQMAIYSSPASLHNVSIHLVDKIIWIRYKAYQTLKYLVSNWMGADTIIKAGFLHLLLKRLLVEERDIIVLILQILKRLLQCNIKRLALQLGALPTMIYLIFHEYEDIGFYARECCELLLSEQNVRIMLDSDTLTFLKTRRFERDRETCLKTMATYRLISTCSSLRRKIAEPEIIDHILDFARRYKNDNSVVLECFTILHNLCEVPVGRRILEERKYYIINLFLPLEAQPTEI